MAERRISNGLSDAEAAARLATDGPNELPRAERRTPWRIFLGVLREPMFALLLAGGVIYLLVGKASDAAILTAFGGLSVSIAIIQELRSERVLEALRSLASPTAIVIRGGVRRRVPAQQLARGDLIAVSEGDRVPADAILREVHDLYGDESLLTGESLPVEKLLAVKPAEGSSLTQPDQIYAGTLIVRGDAMAEVTAIGSATQMGRIGLTLDAIKPEASRLTLQTRQVVRSLGVIAVAICASVLLIQGLRGAGWMAGLLGGIAVGMAMIPEEFPLVLTVFMVMGAWRISRAGVLTRRAAAIETLGSATVLCTDKTGTLTENRMTILLGWADGERVDWKDGASMLAALVRTGVLASAPHPFDPMERAFHAADRGSSAADGQVVHVYGLRPDLLAVTQVWQAPDGKKLVAAKGAPEAMATLCRLDGPERSQVLEAARAMAAEGMRVLGIGRGELASDLPERPHGLDLRFEGLIGLADPIRADVPAAVKACQAAGVRVVMITGDHPETARAVANAAGIDAGGIMTGPELAELPEGDFASRLHGVSVFARILPEQKLRIVQALKRAGEVVAMTGDGVNDAPALRAADIGIAMGERGSDVAREAASLILLKDGFAAIVQTIALGRRIYDNLRRSLGFILAVHVPIAGLATIPLIVHGQMLLGPIHIAFLEMFIDPMCAIAFEAEPEEPSNMRRPPRKPNERVISKAIVVNAILRGSIGLGAVLAAYQLSLLRGASPDQARAAAFAALVGVDVALVLTSRVSMHGRGGSVFRANPTLWLLLGALIGLIGLVLATGAGRALFEFGPLDLVGFGSALAAGAVVLALGLGIARFSFGTKASRDAREN